MGLWTLGCPNEGVYQGDCRVKQKGEKFVLECKSGLTKFKSPRNDTCEAEVAAHNSYPRKFLPHGLTKCERKHKTARKLLARCVKALTPKEGKKAVAICRKTLSCTS